MGRAWTAMVVPLVLLTSVVLSINSHDTRVVDISNSRAERQDASFNLGEGNKVGKPGVRNLGETMKAVSKVNPDCIGANLPACKNGDVDQAACKCKCPFNWMGSLCDKCNTGACKNAAKMVVKRGKKTICKCKCQEGFHGEDCGKGSKCLNGASEVGGSCKCTNAWSGPTCKACELNCQNGGKPNKAQCMCACPANRSPPLCKTCRDPGCLNGGAFENKKTKDGKELCGCRCKKHHAYSGFKCERCVNPGCSNGATWNQAKCKCECANKNWSGSKCHVCKLHCSNGKKRDDKTCTCVDGGNVNYNPCIVGCRHGTLDKKTCKCKCKAGFTGIFCDACKIKKCFNGGDLDHKKTCTCKCKAPWAGKTCKTCTLNCGSHGKVKPKCGGCKCDKTALGKWKGDKCDKCEHPPCKNGGTVHEASCSCTCPRGYNGHACDTCYLEQSNCKNGSMILKKECRCDCTKGTAAVWEMPTPGLQEWGRSQQKNMPL